MKKIFFSVTVLTGVLSALSAAPEIRNGSFELGSDDWTVVRFSRKDQYFRPAPDPKQRISETEDSWPAEPPDRQSECGFRRTFRCPGLSAQRTDIHSFVVRPERPAAPSSRRHDLPVRRPLVRPCRSYLRHSILEAFSLHVPRSGGFGLPPSLHLGKLGREGESGHVVD